MQERIDAIFAQSIQVKKDALALNRDAICQATDLIIQALHDKKKIILFGNGGSAADSQHIAAEFVGRFLKEREALPAISLTTDTSCLTALGNDYSFDIIFARQIEALAESGDVVLAISTSGKSKNVLAGVEAARAKGLKTIAVTGYDGGPLAQLTDVKIIVPAKHTARIQETHSCILHCICELVEEQFC